MVLRIGNRRLWGWILLGMLVPGLNGCALGYVFRQGVHQLQLLARKKPIDEILKDPSVDPQIKERIRTVQEVRAFAEAYIGLRPSKAYQSYVEIEGDVVAFLVSACPKDRLISYLWRFPLVGSFPYKGFFSLEDANKEARALAARDYDTYLSGAVAFSALGWFSDPIYSSMLLMDELDLVYTILHEMVHGTVFFPDRVDFNEQLATFVGWQGTVTFMETVHGRGSSEAQMARRAVSDEKRVGIFLEWAYERLDQYYALPLPSDKIIRGRRRVFSEIREQCRRTLAELETTRFASLEEMIWNNASLLSFWRYRYDSGDMESLFTHLGGDFKAMITLVKAWREDDLDPRIAIQRELATRNLEKAS